MRKRYGETRENTGRHISVFDSMKLQAWFARIACVFLALSFYSFYQSTVNQTKSFVVPLELRLARNTSVLQADAASATVYAKGPEKEIRKLKISDLKVYAGNETVSGNGQGSFPVFLERKGDAAEQTEVSFSVHPEKVYVIYERSMTKRVPINILLTGAPAKDHIAIASASPNSVVISGPKSVVENMKEINTIPIDIERKRQPFTVAGNLEYPQNTSLLYDEKIEIVVNFIRPGRTMRFEGLIPEIFNLKEDLKIVSEMPLISVKVTTKEMNPDELGLKDLRLILDCAEIKDAGRYRIPLQAVVSQKGLGIEIDPARITVEVEKIPGEEPADTQETDPPADADLPAEDAPEEEVEEPSVPPSAPPAPVQIPETQGESSEAPSAEPEGGNVPERTVPASVPVVVPEAEKESGKSVEKDVEHGENRQTGTPDLLH